MSIARSSLSHPLLRSSSIVSPARRNVDAVRSISFAKGSAGVIPTAESSDAQTGLGTITVGIKAGPRFETQPGLAHILKNYTFKSNGRRTALGLIREVELRGGRLSTTLTKEHLFLSARFFPGEEDFFAQILGDVVSSSKFLPHEYNEIVLPQAQTEYSQAINDPTTLGFDQLTQTAYRQRGLGASLFASPSSPISNDEAIAYAQSVFAKDNIAVVASGVSPHSLDKIVSKHFADVRPNKGNVVAGSNKYFGGDARVSYAAPHGVEGPRAHHGHYWVGFQGAHASPELAVLRSHLGGKASVKWGTGLSALLRIGEKVAGARAEAFNLNFSDSGLFGVYVTAPTVNVTAAVKEVTTALKEATQSISSEQLESARRKAAVEVYEETEGDDLVTVATQLLNSGSPLSLEEAHAKVEAVKASDVSSAAAKLLDSKVTTVAVGDVHKLPYADECF